MQPINLMTAPPTVLVNPDIEVPLGMLVYTTVLTMAVSIFCLLSTLIALFNYISVFSPQEIF